MDREKIVNAARAYLDTPFRHQGRTRERGVDCVGLIIRVGDDLGVQLIAPDHYAEAPASNLVLRYADQQLILCEDRELLAGRIAIMWGFDRNEAQHLAVVGSHAGRPTMIHAFSRAGKVVEHTFDRFWQKRLVKLYEFPEVTNG